jgi:hypothetical protein
MYARMVEILANKDETESHIAPSLEFSELPSLVPTKSYMKAASGKAFCENDYEHIFVFICSC